MRAPISIGRLVAIPQRPEAAVKMTMQTVRNRLRPKNEPNQAVAGNTIAFATR